MIPNNAVRFNPKRRSALFAALSIPFFPFENVIAGNNSYPELSLSLYNIHTTETFNGVFWSAGAYNTDALEQINQLLRDHRTNAVIQIDPRLLSVLYLVSNKLGKPKQPFSVISGYRSAETNRKLALKNARVAKNSYHIKGRAIDIRLPGTDTKQIQRAGMALRVGGVGYYQKSDFVHLDTGPHRSW